MCGRMRVACVAFVLLVSAAAVAARGVRMPLAADAHADLHALHDFVRLLHKVDSDVFDAAFVAQWEPDMVSAAWAVQRAIHDAADPSVATPVRVLSARRAAGARVALQLLDARGHFCTAEAHAARRGDGEWDVLMTQDVLCDGLLGGGACDVESAAAGCTCNALGHCLTGTAQLSPWLNATLRFQRELQRELPPHLAQVVGGHNAYQSRANGYGLDDNLMERVLRMVGADPHFITLANQELSFTDQLRVGARHLELDLHYVFGEVRLCHAGGLFYAPLDKAVQAVARLLGIDLEWSSKNVPCMPFDRTLAEGLAEIAAWLHANPRETLTIYSQDCAECTFGHDALVEGAYTAAFGELLVTAEDMRTTFGGVWPSAAQQVAAGKRVLVVSGDVHTGRYMFPHADYWHDQQVRVLTPWPALTPLQPWPWCSNITRGANNRVNCDMDQYGPVDLRKLIGAITPVNLPTLVQCGFNTIAADHVLPSLMAASVWTWAEGETPAVDGDNACVRRDGATGRWHHAPCDAKLPHACVHDARADEWVLGVARPHASPMCPQGYHASAPRDGFANTAIGHAHGSSAHLSVWLTFA